MAGNAWIRLRRKLDDTDSIHHGLPANFVPGRVLVMCAIFFLPTQKALQYYTAAELVGEICFRNLLSITESYQLCFANLLRFSIPYC